MDKRREELENLCNRLHTKPEYMNDDSEKRPKDRTRHRTPNSCAFVYTGENPSREFWTLEHWRVTTAHGSGVYLRTRTGF